MPPVAGRCDVFLAVLSDNYFESAFCCLEIIAAIHLHKKVRDPHVSGCMQPSYTYASAPSRTRTYPKLSPPGIAQSFAGFLRMEPEQAQGEHGFAMGARRARVSQEGGVHAIARGAISAPSGPRSSDCLTTNLRVPSGAAEEPWHPRPVLRHNRVEGQRDLHNSPVATMRSLTP